MLVIAVFFVAFWGIEEDGLILVVIILRVTALTDVVWHFRLQTFLTAMLRRWRNAVTTMSSTSQHRASVSWFSGQYFLCFICFHIVSALLSVSMSDIISVSPQWHRSVSVSCHFLLQAPQCPCSVRTIFTWNRDTAVPVEGNGNLQTLICVLAARPRRCTTLLNPVLWQSWMAAYPCSTLKLKTLFPGWPVMVHDTR